MRSPIYTVKGANLARSVGVSAAGGVAAGLVWGLVLWQYSVGFLSIILGAGLGYAFTRGLEWASGRKRGPVMIGLAVAGIVLSWGVMFAIVAPLAGTRVPMAGLLAVGVGIYFSYQNLR